jgi:hypothetical protein
MEGKELHTDQFQIKSVFFQNSIYIQPALTTASGQQVNSFQKKELAGIYIGSQPAVAVIKNGKNLF